MFVEPVFSLDRFRPDSMIAGEVQRLRHLNRQMQRVCLS
jgi:hypothetical protein